MSKKKNKKGADGESSAETPVETEPGAVEGEDFAEEIEAEEAAADAQTGGEAESLYTKPQVDELLAAERDRQLRILAEYDNFRRRTAREKEQWRAEALEELVRDLLPVLDSFDKARAVETDGAAREGVEVMYKQFQSALANHDVDVIDPAGEAFDPRFHEAMTRMPSGDQPPGTVLQVFEKGYSIRGRLVRAARVAVAADQ